MELLFLDVEATGVADEDRLIQVAADYKGRQRMEYFSSPVPIQKAAMAIHHITEEDVADKPRFDGSELQGALNTLSRNGVALVAHNAKYDLGMLKKEWVEFPKFICTLKIAKYLGDTGMENHQLQYLRYYYDLKVDLGELAPHDALADIIVLEAVFDALKVKLSEKEGIFGEEDLLERMVEISVNPMLLTICNMNKHKGKTWAQVAREDKEYLRWNLTRDELDEDTEFTIKYYLNK